MKAANYVHKIFTQFKPTSYLQYDAQYKKTAKLMSFLQFQIVFLLKFNLARLYQESLTKGKVD